MQIIYYWYLNNFPLWNSAASKPDKIHKLQSLPIYLPQLDAMHFQ